jgi:hypothetical protein
MKFKIQAGAELDLLTKDELSDLLDNHTSDFDRMLSRGLKYGKFSSTLSENINSGASGIYTTGVFEIVGPEQGFVWSVKNITFSNLGATGCDLLINGSNPGDVIHTGLVNSGTVYPGQNGLIIPSGQNLMLGAKNALVNPAITLYYLEVPIRDIGKL